VFANLISYPKQSVTIKSLSQWLNIKISYDFRLPGDDRFMPAVGNGHIATNVFSDTVHINGLYNGRAGESRRARIPSYANIRLNTTLTHHPFKPVYTLDTKEAVFKVRVDRDRSVVTQRIYAHRFYTRTIVNQIQVVAKTHAGKFAYTVFCY
jgi:protein-glucosylgalactosylhydroxylysine glucosidase